MRISTGLGLLTILLSLSAMSQTIGYFNVTSTSVTHFIVTDRLGRRTGVDPRGTQIPMTGRSLDEIPGANYSTSTPGDAPNEEPSPEDLSFEFEYFFGSTEVDGVYRIETIGLARGAYTLYVDISQRAGSSIQPFSITVKGIIDSMQSSFYELEYHGMVGTAIKVRKNVSGGTLRQDVNVSYAKKWLGDQSFYHDLTRELDSLDMYLANRDSSFARRVLEGLQRNVNTAGQQTSGSMFITADAYAIISSDVSVLMNQMPASPAIASLSPSSTSAGSGGFTLAVKGHAFVPASIVLWNNLARSTTLIADSLLQATIPASDITAPGTARVAVVNPGNDTSNVLSFTITQPPSGLAVKLVNSAGTNLTGGSLQYYDGSWKDAVNNNDGTFKVNTTLATASLRMTYEGGSQTKSNVPVGNDTIVSHFAIMGDMAVGH